MKSGSVIGIDTGSTFIDLVHQDRDGRIRFHKQLADPKNFADSVVAGLGAVARAIGTELGSLLADTRLIAHGTTLATNAVLTRTGAQTALLTTAGLRDTLEMRRGIKEEVFDLHFRAPAPLVGRQHRYGVEERIGYDGAVLKALSADRAIEQLDRAIREDGIRSVAICLMHSWINPAHEVALANRVQAMWPDLDVISSYKVLPQIGFYDRVSTTVMSAYTAPTMRTYLRSLERKLSEVGFAGELFVITSSGGLMTPQDVIDQSARTILSGPAAAPAIGAKVCQSADATDALIVDMGGTSFDVSYLANSIPGSSDGGEIGGLRIAFPVTDVRSIPIGGGSIAWIDRGGLLRIGPQSAGASPGPACFGRGGSSPTVTDANLILGYLDPQQFSGSSLAIDRGMAEAALRSGLAGSADDDVTEAAIGIFRLAAVQMAEAVQRTTLSAGLDYRKTPLIVGGGAGPVHASSIGRELNAEMLIVPAGASALCAIGALQLKPRYDAIKGLFRTITDRVPEEIERACSDLTREVSTKVERQSHELRLSYLCDMRYQGQEDSLGIDISPSGLAAGGARYLRDLFDRMHVERRGFALDGEEIEILSVRVTAEWDAGFSVPSLAQNGAPSRQPPRIRQAYDIAADAFRDFKVFSWEALQPGQSIEPPAMIEMIGTTCVLSEPYRCVMDTSRSLLLRASRSAGMPQ